MTGGEQGDDFVTQLFVGHTTSISLGIVCRNQHGKQIASISRVAVQRSDFRKTLANGDADALITSLNRKIIDLSDGTLSS